MNKIVLKSTFVMALAFVASCLNTNKIIANNQDQSLEVHISHGRAIDRVQNLFNFMLCKSKSAWLKEIVCLNPEIIALITQELQGKSLPEITLCDIMDAILKILEQHPDEIAADLARHNLSLEQFKKDLVTMRGIKGIAQLARNATVFSRYTVVMPENLKNVGYFAMGQNLISWNS